MPNIEIRDEPPSRPRRFQFSIRALLILTVVVAVFCSVMFAVPGWASHLVFCFLIMTIPGVLVSILTYGTPYQRTFAIGALLPCCGFLLSQLDNFDGGWEDLEDRLWACLFWSSAALSGVTAIVVRIVLEKRKHEPQKNLSDCETTSSKLDS